MPSSFRLHMRDPEWATLEVKVKEMGFKNLSTYLRSAAFNYTRREIKRLLDCEECKKRPRDFFVDDETLDRLQEISKAQCIPLAALISRLFLEPLLFDNLNGDEKKV
jgi:hypothetical protein